MTKAIPFVKYTNFGNNFVIVDETQLPLLSEQEKERFAFYATNGCFGVGSDNFLVIQPCTQAILQAINEVHHYWENIPDANQADFIFRMFEPDGLEALSCGNGLMCIASHLFRSYGMPYARIMTEIPTANPQVIQIGTSATDGSSWANMGHPHRISSGLVDHSSIESFDDEIDSLEDIEIANFRQSDGLRFFSKQSSVRITGYLTFTGEPHLVIFTHSGFSLSEMEQSFFPSANSGTPDSPKSEKRANDSSELVHFIGQYFDRKYRHIFPAGVNINFARLVDENGTLEYRCFERGINRETLACGTGALAVAFVAKRLGLANTDLFRILPHRCRWYDHSAEILVKAGENGWTLIGRPQQLFQGEFTQPHTESAQPIQTHDLASFEALPQSITPWCGDLHSSMRSLI